MERLLDWLTRRSRLATRSATGPRKRNRGRPDIMGNLRVFRFVPLHA